MPSLYIEMTVYAHSMTALDCIYAFRNKKSGTNRE